MSTLDDDFFKALAERAVAKPARWWNALDHKERQAMANMPGHASLKRVLLRDWDNMSGAFQSSVARAYLKSHEN